MVQRCTKGLYRPGPAGPPGRGFGDPAVLRRAAAQKYAGLLPCPAAYGQGQGSASCGAGHPAFGPVSDL